MKKSLIGLLSIPIVQVTVFLVSVALVTTGGYVIYDEYIKNDNKPIIEESNDDKLAEGQFEIKINAYPRFNNGTSIGTLGIENKLVNRYDMIVQIYLNNTLIYESPLLKPGQKIVNDKLKKSLTKGSYEAIAYFNAYDSDGNEKGKSGAQIIILVDN